MQIGKDRNQEGSRTKISPVGIWITKLRCIVHLQTSQKKSDSVWFWRQGKEMALVSKSSPTAICMLEDCTLHSLCMAWLYLHPFCERLPVHRTCSKLLQSRVLAGWKDGVMHDRGVYHFANGDYLEGVWQEAALITCLGSAWQCLERWAREDIMELPTSMVQMGLWAEGSAPGEVCNEWRKLLLRHFETRCKPILGKQRYACIIYHMIICQSMDSWRLIGTKMQARTTRNTLPFDV